MYKCILIATDGSEMASKAADHGIALAKIHNAKVVVVTVTDIWSSFAMAHDYDQGKKDPIGRYEALAAERRQAGSRQGGRDRQGTGRRLPVDPCGG